MFKLIQRVFLVFLLLASAVYADSFIDKRTGLEWQLAQHLANSWEEAVAGCSSQTSDGGGWRLPNVKEAASLVRPFQNGANVDERYVGVLKGYQFSFYYTSSVAEYDPAKPFWVYLLSLTTGTIELRKENTGVILDGQLYFCVK